MVPLPQSGRSSAGEERRVTGDRRLSLEGLELQYVFFELVGLLRQNVIHSTYLPFNGLEALLGKVLTSVVNRNMNALVSVRLVSKVTRECPRFCPVAHSPNLSMHGTAASSKPPVLTSWTTNFAQ